MARQLMTDAQWEPLQPYFETPASPSPSVSAKMLVAWSAESAQSDRASRRRGSRSVGRFGGAWNSSRRPTFPSAACATAGPGFHGDAAILSGCQQAGTAWQSREFRKICRHECAQRRWVFPRQRARPIWSSRTESWDNRHSSDITAPSRYSSGGGRMDFRRARYHRKWRCRSEQTS
jgi:hypothetical protein